MQTLRDISPDWLTNILRREGALLRGEVIRIATANAQSTTAHASALYVSYSADAQGSCPPQLYLKHYSGSEFDASEVDYYRRDYRDVPDAPLVRSYDAQVNASGDGYYVLLDNLSATHRNCWEVQPSLAFGLALCDALARLHAPHWRRHAAHDAAHLSTYLKNAQAGIEPMIEAMGADLTPTQRAQITQIAATHPDALRQRMRSAENLTLLHGDINPGNILAPIDAESPLLLIDRQPFAWSLRIGFGVSDLAYATVHWWQPDTRRTLESALLVSYHDALVARQVNEYSLEQLRADYLLSIPFSLYVVAHWCSAVDTRERMRWVWQPQLERTLAALSDLNVCVF
jgi:hypothetical protein